MIISRVARSLVALQIGVLLSAAPGTAQQITLVSPHSGTATVGANLTGRQVTFTVSTQSSQSSQRTITILTCSGQITSCSAPGTITIIQSLNVTVTFTSLAGGTGTITLRAEGSTSADQGTITVTVTPPYGVAVTPHGGTEPTRTANTGGYSAAFTVKNTGSNPNTYSFSCVGANGVTCGTVPASIPLGAGAQQGVSMPYSVGAAGTGTLTFTANGSSGGVSDPGSFTVPISAYGVSVTPDAQVSAARLSNTGGYSEAFTVQNTGTANNTYTFTCSGTGGVVCGTPLPGPLAVNAGFSSPVSMPYSVGAAGTGTLTLTATGTNATDNGSFSVPIALNLSIVSGGLFTVDNHFLVQETAITRDNAGRITQFTDARDKVTNYLYGGNGSAFLTKVTRVHDASGPVDLVTDIAYDASGFVSSIKDEGGTFHYFTYDLYGRLRQVKNNSGTVIRAYGYTYSRTSPNWTFNASSPNAVVDTTFMGPPGPLSTSSIQYLDGLGRPIQSVAGSGASFVVASATQYDAMGRPWRTWKPYTPAGAAYDPAFVSNATSFYSSYNGSGAVPYTETTYTPDALSRTKRVTREHMPSEMGYTQYEYSVDPAAKQAFTVVTDEANKKQASYSDVFGNTVRTILGHLTPEATTTQFTYNVLGQRTRATDPRNLNTDYSLDTRGLLTSTTSPDAGAVNYKYDKAGNLRFSQDANQAVLGQVYFTTYDFAGRALVSGLANATFSGLDPNVTQGFETSQNNWVVARQYDVSQGFLWSSLPPPPPLNNVVGRLSGVASKSNAAWQMTYLSYDADGQVATRYTYTEANGGGSPLLALNTTATYTRDRRGALTQRALTVGTNTFYHWYDYDDRGLLWKTFASTTSTKPGTADVTDTYLPSGQPQNYQFQGGPLVPIRYTIRGQTAQIGDPTLATCSTCPFSARYAYLPNGVVDTAEFYNAGSPATQKRYRYAFGAGAYDALNRLKSADFSSWSGSAWTVTPAYDLANVTYDNAGNLQTLQRNRETGTPTWVIDNLTYVNASTSNRLNSVTDAVTAETWDAETGSFTYDANGNMLTASGGPYSITTPIAYNHQNLPTSITRSGSTTTYRYDEAGQRIAKQGGTGNTEVYLREGPATVGVFTVNGAGTPVSSYFNILWEDRVVGRQTVLPTATATRTYNHMDILGSTRAVVLSTTGTVVESYDFEPWGLLMPGRTLSSATPTKEGFSGKEQDTETGLDYFGARYYMPALGRWAAVDPLANKTPEWSPYSYAFDNPVSSIDPDGRQATRVRTCTNFTGACVRAIAAGVAHRTKPLKDAEPVMLLVASMPTMGFATMAAAPALLQVGTDVAVTFGPDLVTRADQIHGELSPRTQNSTTTAVGTAQNADGTTTTLVSSSEGTLRPAQQAALRPGEVAVVGERGVHAEINMLNAAERSGQTLKAVAASRPICPACVDALRAAKVVIRGLLKL